MKYIFSLLCMVLITSAHAMKKSTYSYRFHCDSCSGVTTLTCSDRKNKTVETITRLQDGTIYLSFSLNGQNEPVALDASFAQRSQFLISKLAEFEEAYKK